MTEIDCTECNAQPQLHRKQNNLLELRCECGHVRTIKVAQRLPEGWT